MEETCRVNGESRNENELGVQYLAAKHNKLVRLTFTTLFQDIFISISRYDAYNTDTK